MEKKLLECLLDKAFIKLHNAVNGQIDRLHIPERSASNTVSEQELKLQFIQEFLNCRECDRYSYSIETPTSENYQFTEGGKRSIKPLVFPPEKGKGRRGNIDVVILDGEKRVAIIEFKANNSGEFEHGKDFIKLANDRASHCEPLRFFVEIYSETDDARIADISEKVYENAYYSKSTNTSFIGYSLKHKGTGECKKFIGNDGSKKIIEVELLPCAK